MRKLLSAHEVYAYTCNVFMIGLHIGIPGSKYPVHMCQYIFIVVVPVYMSKARKYEVIPLCHASLPRTIRLSVYLDINMFPLALEGSTSAEGLRTMLCYGYGVKLILLLS